MYLLMNKDAVAARFQLASQAQNGEQPIFEKNGSAPLPIGFQSADEWVENRKASKHNAHLRQIMRECGCGTAEGFIRVTHAASINDTFWVKAAEEDVCWDQVSFYRNPFDETISRLAFEGVGLYGIRISSTSPELSTDGSFRKCWRREPNGIYLYKRGDNSFRNTGLEPYCEALASEIAQKVTGDAVKYGLVRLHGNLASRCRSFTDEQHGYVPASMFGIQNTPIDLLRFYAMHGSEDLFRRMVVLDALTFNIDRHMGNHGMLVDNDTQEPLRMAPIFDLNMTLLPYFTEEMFSDIGTGLLDCGPKIGDDFTRTGQQFVTGEIRSTLIGLKGFQFQFRGDRQFPEWRVKALEEAVNRQLEALLSRDVLYTKDVFISRVMETREQVQPAIGLKEQERQNKDAEKLIQELDETGKFGHILVNILEDGNQQLIVPDRGDVSFEFLIDIKDGNVHIQKDGIDVEPENLFQEDMGISMDYAECKRTTEVALTMRLEREESRELSDTEYGHE